MMIVNGEVEKAPTLYMLRFFSMSMSYLKTNECKPRLYRYRYERDMEIEQITTFFGAIIDRYLPRMLSGIFSPDDPTVLYRDTYETDIFIDRKPTGVFKLPVVTKNESEALKKFLKGGYIRERMNQEQPGDVIEAVFFSNITSPERWAEFVSLISKYCGDEDKTFDATRLNEAVIKQDITISSDTPDCGHGNIFLGQSIEPSLILTISKLLGSQDLIIRDKASEIFLLLLNCRLEAYLRRRLGIVTAEPEAKPNILKTYHTAIEMTLISKACVGVLSSMITVDKKCTRPQKDIVFNFVTEIMSINGRLSIEPPDFVTHKDFEKDEALITLLRAFSYSVFAIQSEHLGNFNDFTDDPDLASARLAFLGEHISACGKKLNEIDYGDSIPPEELFCHSSDVRWPHLHIDCITGTVEEFIKLLPSDTPPQLTMSKSPALHYILRLLLDVHLELSIVMFNTLVPNRRSVEFSKPKNFSVAQVQVVLTLITQIEQMLPLNEFMRTVLLDKKSIKQEDDIRSLNTATHLINALQSYLTDRFPKADLLGFLDNFEASLENNRKKSTDSDEYSSSPKKRKIMEDFPNKLMEMISEFKSEINKNAENKDAKKPSSESPAVGSSSTDDASKSFPDCSKALQDSVYNLTPETVKQLKEVRSASLKNSKRHLGGKRKSHSKKEPLSKFALFNPLHLEDPTKEEVMQELLATTKRKLKKETFEEQVTLATRSVIMRKFMQFIMFFPSDPQSPPSNVQVGEVVDGCDINDHWETLAQQFPFWKLSALQLYYQEVPWCYRSMIEKDFQMRCDNKSDDLNTVKLKDSNSDDAVKKQAVKKSVASKATYDCKALDRTNFSPKESILDHFTALNMNILKKSIAGDNWLFTMNELQLLEKKLKSTFASAQPNPSNKLTEDTREAELLAGRGLSKLINRFEQSRHKKPTTTEPKPEAEAAAVSSSSSSSSSSSKCKCPHTNADADCKDFNFEDLLISRCEFITKDVESHMKNLKNVKCFPNAIGVLEDIGKTAAMIIDINKNSKGEASNGASTAEIEEALRNHIESEANQSNDSDCQSNIHKISK